MTKPQAVLQRKDTTSRSALFGHCVVAIPERRCDSGRRFHEARHEPSLNAHLASLK
jgi:hypothetical protein